MTTVPSREAIDRRLDRVYDPELDESILKLGFVERVQIEGRGVTVTVRLPTYWCAPNFAFMMLADVRDEVAQVPGVETVRVLLHDNCEADTITAGVNAGRSFRETFAADLALDDLEELRRKFQEKGFLARQEVLIRRLQSAGLSDAEIVALGPGDVAAEGEGLRVRGDLRLPLGADDLAKYRHKRELLVGGHALLFTTLEGAPLRADELTAYLRRSRMVRLSIAFNTSLCEGLLRTRYEPERSHETASLGDRLLLEARGALPLSTSGGHA